MEQVKDIIKTNDLSGKTIVSVDTSCVNVIHLYFDDGTKLSLWNGGVRSLVTDGVEKVRIFKIPVKWTVTGEYYVNANSLKEAQDAVYDKELPKGEYLDGSFEVLEDECDEEMHPEMHPEYDVLLNA